MRTYLKTENDICPPAVHSFILTAGKLLWISIFWFGVVLFNGRGSLVNTHICFGNMKNLNFHIEVFSCYAQPPLSLRRAGP